MKKYISIILAVFMMISVLPTNIINASASKFEGGDGTTYNPYQIATAKQLDAVRDDLDASYILVDNIDLSEYGNWEPIGENGKPFTGNFDGDGYNIENLCIKKLIKERDAYGLFGAIVDNSISDVNLINVKINIESKADAGYYVGAIAGWASDTSVITDCTTKGKISCISEESSFTVGGVTGHGKADGCYNYCDIVVEGEDIVAGGIVGLSVNVEQCINYGRIEMTSPSGTCNSAGGIVGESVNDINKCQNYGKIICTTLKSGPYRSSFGDTSNAGGIAGTASCEISNCLNAGDIDACVEEGFGSSSAGGIVGYGPTGKYLGMITNCYNIGENITSSVGGNAYSGKIDGFAGRIAGRSNHLSENYSVNTTKCNGKKPTENVAHNMNNGESKTLSEIKKMTKGLFDIDKEDAEVNISLNGEYTVMVDEEIEIHYGVMDLEGRKKVDLNDLDIEWEIESDEKDPIRIVRTDKGAYTHALVVEGVRVGECRLTMLIDGEEVTSTKVTVIDSLAEIVEEEIVKRADTLKQDSDYKFYKTEFNHLPGMLTEDMNLTVAKVYNIIDNLFKTYKDKTYFYTLVLIDILSDSEIVNTTSTFEKIIDDKIVRHVTKRVADLDLKKEIKKTKNAVEEMLDDLIEKTKNADKVKVGDFLDGLYTSKDMVDEYIDATADIYSLGLMSSSQIRVLEELKNSTDNKALEDACDDVIKMYYNSACDGMTYATEVGAVKAGVVNIEYAVSEIVDELCDLHPYTKLYKGAIDFSTTVSNLAYNADDLSTQALTLGAYAEVTECLKDIMIEAEKEFNRNRNIETATKFTASADLYKVTLIKGCDASHNFIETVEHTEKTSDAFENAAFGIPGIVGNLFSEKTDYDRMLDSVDFIKKEIKAADFYSVSYNYNLNDGSGVFDYGSEKDNTANESIKSIKTLSVNFDTLGDNVGDERVLYSAEGIIIKNKSGDIIFRSVDGDVKTADDGHGTISEGSMFDGYHYADVDLDKYSIDLNNGIVIVWDDNTCYGLETKGRVVTEVSDGKRNKNYDISSEEDTEVSLSAYYADEDGEYIGTIIDWDIESGSEFWITAENGISLGNNDYSSYSVQVYTSAGNKIYENVQNSIYIDKDELIEELSKNKRISFSDVSSSAIYAKAVETMAEYGVITGYEDGTFRPDNTVTRAEAATMIVRMMGKADSVRKGKTIFSDVDKDNWASGYINCAVEHGIINGMGDGTFNQYGEVTYGQIVKMIVCMLGYKDLAEVNGGYSGGGYLYAGSVIKLTQGVSGTGNEAVSRATVARLLYNALDIEFMDPESFHNRVNGAEYKTMKGKTVRTEYLKD